MNRFELKTALLLIITAILLGAFGAHGLKDLVDEGTIDSFKTGVLYQLVHGMAFLVFGVSSIRMSKLKIFSLLLLSGVVLFSGSIYLLTAQKILEVKIPGLFALTPIGGSLMVLAWSWLLIKVWMNKVQWRK